MCLTSVLEKTAASGLQQKLSHWLGGGGAGGGAPQKKWNIVNFYWKPQNKKYIVSFNQKGRSTRSSFLKPNN